MCNEILTDISDGRSADEQQQRGAPGEEKSRKTRPTSYTIKPIMQQAQDWRSGCTIEREIGALTGGY